MSGFGLSLVAAEGFALGGSLIVAIGAQNAFVLRQGLRREAAGLVAAICFACDAVLILAGAAGLGHLIAAQPAGVRLAAAAGAIFVFFYALRSARQALRPQTLGPADAPRRSAASAATAALAVSLLNPHVYLDTVVLLGSISARHGWPDRAAFVAGAVAASALWFFGLALGAARLAPWLASPKVWRLIDGAIAIILIVVGVGLARFAIEA